MFDKDVKRAVRYDTNPPSDMAIDVSTTQGNPVKDYLIKLSWMKSWTLALRKCYDLNHDESQRNPSRSR